MIGRQQRALAALIRSPTIEAAAEASGIGYTTLRRWIREDDDFRAAYQAELTGLVEAASTQAKQSLSPALSTLREIAEDPDVGAAARVAAARALLEYSLKLTELADIVPRLEALEQSAREEE